MIRSWGDAVWPAKQTEMKIKKAIAQTGRTYFWISSGEEIYLLFCWGSGVEDGMGQGEGGHGQRAATHHLEPTLKQQKMDQTETCEVWLRWKSIDFLTGLVKWFRKQARATLRVCIMYRCSYFTSDHSFSLLFSIASFKNNDVILCSLISTSV